MSCTVEPCGRRAVARGWCDTHYRRWRRTGTTDVAAPWVPDACSITDCDRPADSRTYCEKHYQRWYSTGTTDDPRRPNGCAVGDCPRPHSSKSYCRRHYRLWRKHGDPLVALNRTPAWLGDEVGYEGAHTRVRQARGRASEHPCSECGRKAKHWAYDHLDSAAKTSPRGYVYSLDIDRYLPMCAPCHVEFDRLHRKAIITGGLA